MADKQKVISVHAIENVIRNEADDTVELDWYGETLAVKKRLSIGEMLVFVNGVTDNCFTEELVYIPEVADYVRRCAILELYGNFRLPQDTEKRYKFVYSEPMEKAVDMILNVIDMQQYMEIMDALQNKIDYRINTDIERANRRVSEAEESLLKLENDLREVFSGLTAEDVSGLIGALARGVDEEKIVNAYVDRQQRDAAYATSLAELPQEPDEAGGE